MAPPAQALLASLTAHTFFGKWRTDKDEADEDTMLECGGVEIVVNGGRDNHSHAVYPHFDDNPENKPVAYPAFDDASHAVYPHFDDNPNSCVAYPAFDHAHAVYPHFYDEPNGCFKHRSVAYPTFDCKPSGLIGETLEGGTPVDTGGSANLIASTFKENGRASYTHSIFSNVPEKSAEKLFGAHVFYPVFKSSGGLIGETANYDAIIGHDGIEIITKDCVNGPFTSVVYPHSRDRPEHSTCAHAFYSKLEDEIGGLIGEKSKEDAIISNHDMNIIAGNDDETGNESRAGAHALHPPFAEKSGGLIGDKNNKNISVGTDGVNILPIKNCSAGTDAVMDFTHKNMHDDNVDHLDELIKAFGNSKIAPPEVCGSASNRCMGFPSLVSHLKSDCSHGAMTEKENEMSWLLAAFFSLPFEEVFNTMKAATSVQNSFDDKPNIFQHTCTGHGSWDEQFNAVRICSPALVAVAS